MDLGLEMVEFSGDNFFRLYSGALAGDLDCGGRNGRDIVEGFNGGYCGSGCSGGGGGL